MAVGCAGEGNPEGACTRTGSSMPAFSSPSMRISRPSQASRLATAGSGCSSINPSSGPKRSAAADLSSESRGLTGVIQRWFRPAGQNPTAVYVGNIHIAHEQRQAVPESRYRHRLRHRHLCRIRRHLRRHRHLNLCRGGREAKAHAKLHPTVVLPLQADRERQHQLLVRSDETVLCHLQGRGRQGQKQMLARCGQT